MYVHGTDKKGHPVVYMRTAFDPPGTAEEKIKFIMYTLEETIRHMPADSSIEKWMIVTDLHGFSLAKHGDSQVSRKFVEILQDHYPERLHSMVAINAPAIFVGFYKALSVFIDKTTRKKFQVKGKMDKKAAHEYLTQYITQDQLEDCYDGDLPTKVPPNIVEILEPLWEQHKSAIKEAKKEGKLDKKASKQANKLKNSASIEGESKVGGGTDSHTDKLTKVDTVYLDDSELVDEMAKL